MSITDTKSIFLRSLGRGGGARRAPGTMPVDNSDVFHPGTIGIIAVFNNSTVHIIVGIDAGNVGLHRDIDLVTIHCQLTITPQHPATCSSTHHFLTAIEILFCTETAVSTLQIESVHTPVFSASSSNHRALGATDPPPRNWPSSFDTILTYHTAIYTVVLACLRSFTPRNPIYTSCGCATSTVLSQKYFETYIKWTSSKQSTLIMPLPIINWHGFICCCIITHSIQHLDTMRWQSAFG